MTPDPIPTRRNDDPLSTSARVGVPAFTGVGEVWCGPRRLADVYYQLDGVRDSLLRTGAPVLRSPQGQLTLLLGDWWAVLCLQERGEELRLSDNQRTPFLIYGAVRPRLWVRCFRALDIPERPVDRMDHPSPCRGRLTAAWLAGLG